MGECFSLPYFKRRYSVSNNAEVTLLTMECPGPIEPRCEKTGLWGSPTRAVQPQKMARCLKFRI